MNLIEDIHLPFQITRKHFSVCLSFAMTINKAQRKICQLFYLSIYLSKSYFCHDRLYVILSRYTSYITTNVLVKKEYSHSFIGIYTRNVVYNRTEREHYIEPIGR